MTRAIILQHLDREGPGRIAELAAERGLDVEVRHVDQGAPVPEQVAQGDLLVVMGGPMGVADVGGPRHPFLAAELALLRRVLARRSPVLGVCLGAQLLAAAAGARVYPNRDPRTGEPAFEVGFAPVRYLHPVREPALAGLDEREIVLHWHGDTFDLPAGAVQLATTDACANQAFRLGHHAFGLQFHVEVDAATACRWAEEDAEFVLAALGAGGPHRVMASAEQCAARLRGPGDRLLRNILAILLEQAA